MTQGLTPPFNYTSVTTASSRVMRLTDAVGKIRYFSYDSNVIVDIEGEYLILKSALSENRDIPIGIFYRGDFASPGPNTQGLFGNLVNVGLIR